MDQEKIGKFIKKLREERGWSQELLANKIHITREAISKWERSKSYPNIESIKQISELFKVSIDELLAGERNPKQSFSLKFYDYNLRTNKKLKISIIVIFVMIILFFIYYFINQYKSINVYTITGIGENFNISSGLLIKTSEKLYFSITNIESNNENVLINNIDLYYNDEDNIIYSANGTSIQFYDYNGYNEYFDFSKINDIIENLYLKIYYNDTSETIKLSFTKDYENANLFFFKQTDVSKVFPDDETENNEILDIISKIKEKYNYDEDNEYYYFIRHENDLIYTFNYDLNTITLNINNKNDYIIEYYLYVVNSNYFEYINYKEDIDYIIQNDTNQCLKGDCSSIKKNVENVFIKLIYSTFD